MVVFLIGGGNGSVREQEHEKHHAAAMQRWGKAQSRTMNRVKRQVAAARRAAEAGQQVTDPELIDALTELRAAKRMKVPARNRTGALSSRRPIFSPGQKWMGMGQQGARLGHARVRAAGCGRHGRGGRGP